MSTNPKTTSSPTTNRRSASGPAPASTPSTTINRQAAFERELPHSLDAERALLGSLLLEDAAINEAVLILQELGPSAFWFEKHQQLYDHVIKLWQANKPLDGVVIKDELERLGAFEELGGYDFLAGLVSAVPSAYRVREYAQIVRDKANLRHLVGAAHKVMEKVFEDNAPPPEILDYAEKTIFDITERRVSSGPQPLPDLIEDVFKQIEASDGKAVTGAPTGYFELDDLTCGFQPAELIIIAARPSMGKTALGLNLAEHMALTENPPRPALFFSLEMSSQQVAQRILCSRARVDAQRLRRGQHTPDELGKLMKAADDMRSKPLFIDDTSSLTILELRARARMAFRKQKIAAVFVDYLQLARAPGVESRQQEVAEVSRGLKALAKELHIPVIAMAQLNRKTEDRTGNRPRMSDLRESGAIEQDADLIALLHRESYYKSDEGVNPEDDNKAELIIAKQRNGPVGTLELHFNRQFTRFDNPSVGQRYEGTPEAYYGPETEHGG